MFYIKRVFKTKKVDNIITILSNNNTEILFKFSAFCNREKLKNARKSAYYLTKIEEILKFILKNKATYAIIALLCFADILQLVIKTNPKVCKRIKFIIGIVFCQLKSKKIAQTLVNLNFKTHKFIFIDDWSSNYDYKISRNIFCNSIVFISRVCNSCSNIFQLCVSVVLMDAWIQKFTKYWRSHFLVITRNSEINEIFKNVDKKILYYIIFNYQYKDYQYKKMNKTLKERNNILMVS